MDIFKNLRTIIPEMQKSNKLGKMSLTEEVEEVFRLYDTDGNGTLDVSEAAVFMDDWMKKNVRSGDVPEVKFDDIDLNKDGVISKEELKQFLFDQRIIHAENF